MNATGTPFSIDAGTFPVRVTLELTNICNLSCTFCPRKLMERSRGYMNVALAKRLIDEMSEHDCHALVPFFRGESLLHPEWEKILRHARQRLSGELQFTSNAALLTTEAADRLLALGIDFISFSLDTLDPALYNASRRGGDLEKAMRNVRHFIARRDQLNAPTRVQISSVQTKAHRPGMDRFIDYWTDRADRVRVYTEHSSDGNPGSIGEELPNFEERKPCRKPFTDIAVYWNGTVAACNHDWTRLIDGSPLGDASKSDIHDIWTSTAYQRLRGKHLDGNLEDCSPCTHCDHWKMYYMEEGFLGRTYLRKTHRNAADANPGSAGSAYPLADDEPSPSHP
jgi:MoaA/NifB/PqqE/SkfB family radical SAM enzyme